MEKKKEPVFVMILSFQYDIYTISNTRIILPRDIPNHLFSMYMIFLSNLIPNGLPMRREKTYEKQNKNLIFPPMLPLLLSFMITNQNTDDNSITRSHDVRILVGKFVFFPFCVHFSNYIDRHICLLLKWISINAYTMSNSLQQFMFIKRKDFMPKPLL